MKTILLHLTLVAALCGPVLADKEATASGVSASGNIAWSVNPDTNELNLVPARGGSDAKLCEIIGTSNLSVHFSPDDRFIFVTDGGASLGIHVTLYKHSSGVSYREDSSIDFDLAVQRLAMEAETGKKIDDTVLDHSYLKCLGWTKKGQAILQLSGSGKLNGKKIEISGFQCVFDPVERSFAAKGR